MADQYPWKQGQELALPQYQKTEVEKMKRYLSLGLFLGFCALTLAITGYALKPEPAQAHDVSCFTRTQQDYMGNFAVQANNNTWCTGLVEVAVQIYPEEFVHIGGVWVPVSSTPQLRQESCEEANPCDNLITQGPFQLPLREGKYRIHAIVIPDPLSLGHDHNLNQPNGVDFYSSTFNLDANGNYSVDVGTGSGTGEFSITTTPDDPDPCGGPGDECPPLPHYHGFTDQWNNPGVYGGGQCALKMALVDDNNNGHYENILVLHGYDVNHPDGGLIQKTNAAGEIDTINGWRQCPWPMTDPNAPRDDDD